MKEKNYNLELIRTISFVLVVVIHVSNYFCRAFGKISGGEYGFALVLDTLARISVPSFFMLSGALLLGREESVETCWKRGARFLPPLLIWSIVYYLFNVYYMGSEFQLEKILWMPVEAHLWYLYAMIPLYLVLPFFQVLVRHLTPKMEKALLLLGTGAILFNYGLSLFDGALYYDVPLFGDRVYSYYFFLGFYLMKYKEKIRIRNRWLVVIFLASNTLTIGLTAVFSVITGDHVERTLEYGFPLIILSSVAFFLWMLRLGNGNVHLKASAKRVIDRWCACSFGIYLIHIIFLDMFKKHVAATEVSAYLAIPGLTIGILFLSYLCVSLIRRVVGGKRIT